MMTDGNRLDGLAEGSLERVSYGVDWLTALVSGSDAAERAEFHVGLWMATAQEMGERVRTWRIGRATGHVCGPFAYARLPHAGIVQITGAPSSKMFDRVMAFPARPSRLDVQVTYRRPSWGVSPAKRAYLGSPDDARRGRAVRSRTIIVSKGGGETCYVGAPSSEHRMRVYDKGAESGSAPAGTVYRWEVQLRRKVAQTAAARLLKAGISEDSVESLCASFSARYGVDIPRGAVSNLWIHSGSEGSSIERTKAWLRDSVKPAVDRLRMHMLDDEIARLLGLHV